MTHSPSASSAKLVYSLASIAGLVLLLVWMQGGFTHKTPPGTAQAAEPTPAKPLGPTAKAELKEIGEILRWPGTVTARSVAQIAPKLPARVLAINVKAGDAVRAGQVLAQLDASEAQSRVGQARSALAAAQAQEAKAMAELRRTQSLHSQEAATQQSLEAAQAAARTASAQVEQARAAIATAESWQTETVLRAPFDGAVVKRLLEPGDLAQPNAPVLTVQSSQRLRVETAIPESCAGSVRLGDSLKISLGGQAQTGKVEEIAPAADPQTRTVLVKAGLEAAAQPGAFAWVEQACGRHTAVLIPAAAVSRSGQLELVRLAGPEGVKLRHVRTGKVYDGQIEVLSGLKEGDVVVLGGEK